jgi:hypothetical protein
MDIASRAGLKTIICVPIMKQTQPIGVLEFLRKMKILIKKF